MTKVVKKSEIDKPVFQWRGGIKNPEWKPENLVPIRSCLYKHKAKNNEPDFYHLSRTPKWISKFAKGRVNKDTGEIEYEREFLTDEFQRTRIGKIKTINRFSDFYEPLYQSRNVSLLFHTFTRLNFSREDMRSMLENVKARYRALKCPVLGYLWVLEVSDNNHIHYHLVVAIKRVQWSRIPERLKFEDLWGQRTGVEFIRKSVRAYLVKYLSKSYAKVLGKRSYAISRQLKEPETL